MNTFEQILEMDEDNDKEFSKGIVYGFFEQAETTFDGMETSMFVTPSSIAFHFPCFSPDPLLSLPPFLYVPA